MNIIQKTGILILSLVASCSTKRRMHFKSEFHLPLLQNAMCTMNSSIQEITRTQFKAIRTILGAISPIEPIKFEENKFEVVTSRNKAGWKSFSNKDTDKSKPVFI